MTRGRCRPDGRRRAKVPGEEPAKPTQPASVAEGAEGDADVLEGTPPLPAASRATMDATTSVFQWLNEHDEWSDYSEPDQEKLNEAYRRGRTNGTREKVEIKPGGYHMYRVDLDTPMMQQNIRTWTKRHVRRKEVESQLAPAVPPSPAQPPAPAAAVPAAEAPLLAPVVSPPPAVDQAGNALPAGWEPVVSRSHGDTYYKNVHTGETMWDIPTQPAPGFPADKTRPPGPLPRMPSGVLARSPDDREPQKRGAALATGSATPAKPHGSEEGAHKKVTAEKASAKSHHDELLERKATLLTNRAEFYPRTQNFPKALIDCEAALAIGIPNWPKQEETASRMKIALEKLGAEKNMKAKLAEQRRVAQTREKKDEIAREREKAAPPDAYYNRGTKQTQWTRPEAQEQAQAQAQAQPEPEPEPEPEAQEQAQAQAQPEPGPEPEQRGSITEPAPTPPNREEAESQLREIPNRLMLCMAIGADKHMRYFHFKVGHEVVVRWGKNADGSNQSSGAFAWAGCGSVPPKQRTVKSVSCCKRFRDHLSLQTAEGDEVLIRASNTHEASRWEDGVQAALTAVRLAREQEARRAGAQQQLSDTPGLIMSGGPTEEYNGLYLKVGDHGGWPRYEKEGG
eukprot:COSAG02_NODE_7707_length_2882_cov_2.810277_1_plen_623_part_10